MLPPKKGADMKIHVKYFPRWSEGRLAPAEWLDSIYDDRYTEAYDDAQLYADEVSVPGSMGDDWQSAFDNALDINVSHVNAEDERRRHKIYFADEGICSCCNHQCGMSFPWEYGYHNSYLDTVGECEACYIGLCECVEDHA